MHRLPLGLRFSTADSLIISQNLIALLSQNNMQHSELGRILHKTAPALSRKMHAKISWASHELNAIADALESKGFTIPAVTQGVSVFPQAQPATPPTSAPESCPPVAPSKQQTPTPTTATADAPLTASQLINAFPLALSPAALHFLQHFADIAPDTALSVSNWLNFVSFTLSAASSALNIPQPPPDK